MKTKLLIAAILSTASTAYAGCGSAFCSVNTHWDAQGLINDDGLRVDLRYSYAKADTPRVGSSKVTNDLSTAAADEEIENLRTINQSVNLDVAYTINRQLSVALGLPLVIRDHSHTIADGAGSGTVEQGSFNKIGDIRLIGNYKFNSDHHSGSGIRFGLKLPTGSTTWEFQPGAFGERSLQSGSGSTDAILGAYYHQDLADSPWGWFTSAQVQTALSTKDNYRPGNDVSIDIGSHYAISQTLAGLLQLNAQFKERDKAPDPVTGTIVETHSGGRSLNFSPGLSVALASRTKLYGFVQLPLYQYANPDPASSTYGQLTAPWSFSIGVSHSY